MPEAVALGELLIDFVSLDRDVPLSALPRFTGAAGGAPANVAAGLARLGVSAGFVGKVGRDPFGDFLAHALEAEGVDVSHLQRDADTRTTLAFLATRRDGRKDVTFYRNPGADMLLSPAEVPVAYLRTARLFHFGSVSLSRSPAREATLHAAREARAAELLVCYDPNWRPSLWDDHAAARDVIWEAMRLADVVHCCEEELEFVTGECDLQAGAEAILAAGAKLVVLTAGEDGCAYRTSAVWGRMPGFTVEVADATGAGDAFMAAVLTQLLRRGVPPGELSAADLSEIATYANAAGALTCTKPGVIPSLPRAEELEAFLRARHVAPI